MIYYDKFIPEWIKRSERNGVSVDDGDRFISLWIAFNGWLRKTYGESVNDSNLIKKACKNTNLVNIFDWLEKNDPNFIENLEKLKIYRIRDMRDQENEEKFKRFAGGFKSFLEVVYHIRCNLFHGRKNVQENATDLELITLALKLLSSLFNKYLKEHENFQPSNS